MSQEDVVFETEIEKAPTLFLELVDQRDSGFIQDDTKGTAHENQLRAPGYRFIPNFGMRLGQKEEIRNGKKVLIKYHEKIQHIAHETEISVQRQKELGIEKSSLAREDKIVVEKGYMSVAREGAYIGLYDFIMESFYNVSNPNRSEKATGIYRIVEYSKRTEAENEIGFLELDAETLARELVEKRGNLYVYKEEKIDGICEMFSLFGESYAAKFKMIRSFARAYPKEFLEKVTIWEQTTETEVTHAFKLNVIIVDKGTVSYADKGKIIRTIDAKLKKDEQISFLADWFRTSEGHEAYMEFKAQLEYAKDKK